jgi:hypothetical protein
MFFSKTTRAQFFWRRMGKLRSASAQSTLTSGISLLPTVLKRKKYQWYGALRGGGIIGDFATKPLQGALFRKFIDQIMGVTREDRQRCRKIETSKNKPKKGRNTIGTARNEGGTTEVC